MKPRQMPRLPWMRHWETKQVRCYFRQPQHGCLGDLFLGSKGCVEDLLLRNAADEVFHLLEMLHQIHAPVQHPTLDTLQIHAVETVHHRGLTCARRTQQRHQATLPDLHMDIPNQLFHANAGIVLHLFGLDIRDQNGLLSRCLGFRAGCGFTCFGSSY